jgi:hypothetical protein
LFEDGTFNIRYLVLRESDWLRGQQLLISPQSIETVDSEKQQLRLSLRQQEVQASPLLADDLPVSRQYETRLHGHFGWRPYWTGESEEPRLSQQMPAADVPEESQVGEVAEAEGLEGQAHLRSVRELVGYVVRDSQGLPGSATDFVLDDSVWLLRFLMVKWQHNGEVDETMLSTELVTHTSWEERAIYVDIERDQALDEFSNGSELGS